LQGTDTVQSLQGLLLNRLDTNWPNVGGAGGLQESRVIGRIGLVALDVGTHVLGRQHLDLDAQAGEPARPVVGGAAGFHDDQ